MKTLAEISLEYVWLMLFGSDEIIDPDYAVKMQESLPEYFASMSQEEKAAFAKAGAEARARLLADPDEHGYTPRKLVTDEERVFLDALSSGKIFEEWP